MLWWYVHVVFLWYDFYVKILTLYWSFHTISMVGSSIQLCGIWTWIRLSTGERWQQLGFISWVFYCLKLPSWLDTDYCCFCPTGRVLTTLMLLAISTFRYMEFLEQLTQACILMGSWVKMFLEVMVIHQCQDMLCQVIRLCSLVDQVSMQ